MFKACTVGVSGDFRFLWRYHWFGIAFGKVTAWLAAGHRDGAWRGVAGRRSGEQGSREGFYQPIFVDSGMNWLTDRIKLVN